MSKFTVTAEEEIKFNEFKVILRQALYENSAFIASCQSFISNLPSKMRNHPWIKYMEDYYIGDGIKEPHFLGRFWAKQDPINDSKFSKIPNFTNPNQTNNTCERKYL